MRSHVSWKAGVMLSAWILSQDVVVGVGVSDVSNVRSCFLCTNHFIVGVFDHNVSCLPSDLPQGKHVCLRWFQQHGSGHRWSESSYLRLALSGAREGGRCFGTEGQKGHGDERSGVDSDNLTVWLFITWGTEIQTAGVHQCNTWGRQKSRRGNKQAGWKNWTEKNGWRRNVSGSSATVWSVSVS